MCPERYSFINQFFYFSGDVLRNRRLIWKDGLQVIKIVHCTKYMPFITSSNSESEDSA